MKRMPTVCKSARSPNENRADRSTSKLKSTPTHESVQSPKVIKTRSSNYFNQTLRHDLLRIKTQPEESLNSVRSPQPSSKRAQINSTYLLDSSDSTKECENLQVQLKLETQSRQIYQQQVKELSEIMQSKDQQIGRLEAQLNNLPYDSTQRQAQYQHLQQETNQLRRRHEQMLHEIESLKGHLKIAQGLNKQLEQQLKSATTQKYSSFKVCSPRASPEKRPRSPFLAEKSLQNQKYQLENQLQISKQNKNNIEKALEVKLAESCERETYLIEKIHRLEAQLKSKVNFEKQKQEQNLLEQKLKELNQSLDYFKKQVKEHNHSVIQLKNAHQKECETMNENIKNLQSEKGQQENEVRRLIALNRKLEDQLAALNSNMSSAQQDKQDFIQQKLKLIEDLRTQNDLLKNKQQLKEKEIQELQQSLNMEKQAHEQLKRNAENQSDSMIQCREQLLSAREELRKEKLQSERLNKEFELSKQRQNEMELRLNTLTLEKQTMLKQLAIAEQVNGFTRSSWNSEFSLIKAQSDDIDKQLENYDAAGLNLYSVEEQNSTIKEQLSVFETDMNQGLISQIQQTNLYLQELQSLIMG